MDTIDLEKVIAQLKVLTCLLEDLETRHEQRFDDLKQHFDHELARLRQRVHLLENM